jgi:N-acetylglucosamine-6-phosphate deacetylase
MLAFTARRLLTPVAAIDRPFMLVEHGQFLEISALTHGQPPAGVSVSDLGDGVIVPGYIDLHIHGSAGYDVMDDDAEALPAVERLLSRNGVTSYFPTTVTAPIDATLRALERLADSIERRELVSTTSHSERPNKEDRGRGRPLGIHLEGPFISHARRGVHPPEDLLAPTLNRFEQFWQAARGRIRMMTIAPELDGALEVIAEATRRGVCVSLGHSDADFEEAERGITAGARHATHTFNAMRPLDHRSPGILGAVLTDSRVSVDIIADGIHLDRAIVKLVAEAKRREQLVLITDAMSATGMPEGRYRLGSLEVDVRDGKCTVDGRLAGSVLTMERAVLNLVRFAEWDLQQAVAAASQNPAQVAQIAEKGVLAAGADADFLVLSAEGEVLRTFIGGIECPR